MLERGNPVEERINVALYMKDNPMHLLGQADLLELAFCIKRLQ